MKTSLFYGDDSRSLFTQSSTGRYTEATVEILDDLIEVFHVRS
ncbi:hypothetical protein [Cylindrospermum sp. FACHB-282]|nr:hypothetical protein [Cylindrospermum sp. FACHB-282]